MTITEHTAKNVHTVVETHPNLTLRSETPVAVDWMEEKFDGCPFCKSYVYTEYASHATFLEYVRSNNEFYSMFFVNSDEGWR